jgi:hypothetical protein
VEKNSPQRLKKKDEVAQRKDFFFARAKKRNSSSVQPHPSSSVSVVNSSPLRKTE